MDSCPYDYGPSCRETRTRYPHTQEELDAIPWEAITEEDYSAWLGCVPPIRHAGPAFAVGEPACDLYTGPTVYRVCACVRDPDNQGCSRYFTKFDTLNRFDHVQYVQQINRQLSETVVL